MKSSDKTAQENHPKYLSDQSNFFDELVQNDWEPHQDPRWDKQRRFEVDRLFERISPELVLDVGCGVGFHDKLIAEKLSVKRVLGIDYSEKSIHMAEKHFPHENVRREVNDIFEMESGDYDLVVSFQVIEHLEQPVEFFKACKNQVNDDGIVAVATPNRLRMMNRFLKRVGLGTPPCDPQHFQEYTESDLVKLGEQAGLSRVDSFSRGLNLKLPRLGWNVIPHDLGLHLGYLFPAVANNFCVMFSRKN